MRLPRKSRCARLSLIFVSLVFAANVAGQDLSVKLPGASSTTKESSKNPSITSSATAALSSTAASASESGALSGLPKLAQDDYPAPTVPPTANAPFMQRSSLPNGTVFICVGAALAFFGCLVLAWRGLVAWSLHRSVKRAAMAQSAKYSQLGDPRAKSRHSKSPYFSPGLGSTLSLDQLGASGKGGGRHNSSAHGSLFFSPTAGAGMHTPSNRGSGYLPAGYYAAGNSAPGGGSGMSHIGGGIGLSNLAPQNRQYSRARSAGPSPPGSPSLPPSRERDSAVGGRPSTAGLTTHGSESSLILSVPPQGRAPSAYLEDLFENHPPGTPPSEEHSRGNRF